MTSKFSSDDILRDVFITLLQDVTGLFVPIRTAEVLVAHAGRAIWDHSGQHLAERARQVFCEWMNKYEKRDLPAIFDKMISVPFARAWQIAAEEVAKTDLPEDQKETLVKYLAAIPMTSRQAINRWNDGGHITTLPSQLPRNPAEASRFVPIRPPLFRPTQKILGYDLQLDTLLGQGGFAEVWKAHNTERKGAQPVALKFCTDLDLIPSLRREIAVLDRLGDERSEDDYGKDFVQLKQTAFSADPPFLVYEYIDGGNLANWIESFQGDAPAPKDVISILKMIARAAAVAHDKNIVHRDLKPSNILMTKKGRAKIADFGIGAVVASAMDSKAAPATDELSTQLRGAHTPMYTDPRRAHLDPPHPRDDVYAIGVIAYQLLEGDFTIPIEGDWQSYLEKRGIDARLIRTIRTCVAHTEERFRNAGALLASLEDLEDDVDRTERPSQDPKRQTKSRPSFCHQCGGKVQSDNRFCIYCGYRLS